MNYIKRWIEPKIKETLRANPVIILTGPRQVGKSTLLEFADFLKGWKYITLDDPDALEQAREDSKGLLWEDRPTIIDEVQRCPELLIAIKYIVDKSRRKRKFILSGSGNVSLRQSPRESLAGRATYINLTGFALRERDASLHEKGALDYIFNDQVIPNKEFKIKKEIYSDVWKGGLPNILLASSTKIVLNRMNSYVDTYIQRDIQDLVKIRHPQRFRTLMEILAKSTGWESVQTELSKECGEERSNVSRYISLLKETKLLYELKGYARKKESAYKQSKYYWFDSGVACFLSGIYSSKDLMNPKNKGRFLENYILQQLVSWASLQLITPDIYYWKRKSQDFEVDFIIKNCNKTVGVEVKSAKEVSFKDTKSMREFLNSHQEAKCGIIVYSGNKVFPIASNIWAVPWFFI